MTPSLTTVVDLIIKPLTSEILQSALNDPNLRVKYPTYMLHNTSSPKFSSVFLYDQVFTNYFTS